MLHAGVLKKFGLYGLVQLAIPLLPAGGISWGPFLLWLALGNIIIVGAITISQSNLKSMIGNGSVMHMVLLSRIGCLLVSWCKCYSYADVCPRTVSLVDVSFSQFYLQAKWIP